MIDLLKQFASEYPVLSRDEELELLAKYKNDDEILFLKLIQHNSRYILQYARRWVEAEEAASKIILELLTHFHAYDHRQSFVYYSKYLMRTATHRKLSQVILEDIEDHPELCGDTPEYCDDLEDLLVTAKTLLNVKEYEMISNIYVDHMSVGEAGDIYGICNASRKHCEILAKLKRSTKLRAMSCEYIDNKIRSQ